MHDMLDIFSLYGRIFDFAIPWVKKFRYNTDAVTAYHIGAGCRLWCYWWIDQCFCFFKCRIVLLYVYVWAAFRWKIIYIYTKTSSVKYKDNYLFILMQAYININLLLPAPSGSLPPSHNSFTLGLLWWLLLFLSKYFISYRINDLD